MLIQRLVPSRLAEQYKTISQSLSETEATKKRDKSSCEAVTLERRGCMGVVKESSDKTKQNKKEQLGLLECEKRAGKRSAKVQLPSHKSSQKEVRCQTEPEIWRIFLKPGKKDNKSSSEV